MTTEADVWKKIRAAWPGHCVRVEASIGGVDPGTPDSNLGIAGRGLWVELKVWPTPLSAEQIAWHADCAQRDGGAEVWCWVGRDSIWCGDAATYELMTRRCEGRKPPNGMPLQAALDRLSEILHSDRRVI